MIKRRGDPPGLVHVLSAMEACKAYEPWHGKRSHQTFLRHTSGKCLHCYRYFIDDTLGVIYLRVPTWCPFRLQFYCNGHSWLARSLKAAGIGYTMADNAFIRLDDRKRAQQLADAFSPDTHACHARSLRGAVLPVLDAFGQRYRRSLMQVATFLGKKITAQLTQEIGSRFATRVEGTCVNHCLGKVLVKMYDKFGRVLRLETTTNDLSFFTHQRKLEHRNGHLSGEWRPSKRPSTA
ncbi:hypothetical protein [Accumulibacter sp.]|uniref:hypothetical protein n=1 Tax=Accumulibacter sp. TaxID=2053492 RepID=UPI0028C3845C|nr:hypothetical protein [Accumulibacter sp.]